MNTHEIVQSAIGFDLETELALCQRLATVGGVERVRDEFDSFRARRLFQTLLSTGRYTEMSEHWRESVEAGVEVGTLARPEWN